MDHAPAAVRWTLALACLGILLGVVMLGLMAFDTDLSWNGWDNVSVGDTNVAKLGIVGAVAGTALLIGLSIALVVGLVNRERWGQFLGVIMNGGGALDGVWDLTHGRLNLATPLVLTLAWFLFREHTWFRGLNGEAANHQAQPVPPS